MVLHKALVRRASAKATVKAATSPTTTNITRDPIYMWSSLAASVSSGAPRQRIAPLSIWYGRGLQVWEPKWYE
jgi:hypothetical protein